MARLQIESMIKHFQQTNNLRNLAAEYVFLGIYYTNEGNKKKSLECAQKALSLLEPTEEWAVKSMALYHLGGEYLELGNTLDAEHYLELSLEAGEKARDRNACIVAMEKLAELHRKTGNREQEKFFVEKIKSIDNAI
ncbi:MAG TPA: hypothetical protein VKK79_24075 [Candidatus Lokiarchaeia archaeon]|nr:hypothetical protein [Candidatus Lokiarchaeia archaeon]